MTKTILLASAVSLAALSSAFAADLPGRKTAPAAPVAPVFTWTGFYAGLNAGVNWSNRNVNPAYIDNDPVNPWTPQELIDLWPVPAPWVWPPRHRRAAWPRQREPAGARRRHLWP